MGVLVFSLLCVSVCIVQDSLVVAGPEAFLSPSSAPNLSPLIPLPPFLPQFLYCIG